jgi:hypothetical protein
MCLLLFVSCVFVYVWGVLVTAFVLGILHFVPLFNVSRYFLREFSELLPFYEVWQVSSGYVEMNSIGQVFFFFK